MYELTWERTHLRKYEDRAHSRYTEALLYRREDEMEKSAGADHTRPACHWKESGFYFLRKHKSYILFPIFLYASAPSGKLFVCDLVKFMRP